MTPNNPSEVGSHNAPLVPDSIASYTTPVKRKSTLGIKTHKRSWDFVVYENCVEFHPRKKTQTQKHKNTKPRGNISKFSKKSRFNLFRTLAKVQGISDRPVWFITLTYHESWTAGNRQAQTDFHNFLSSLRRHDPDVSYIWRIELQKRGVPHFHMIVLPSITDNRINVSDLKKHIHQSWHRIAEPNSRSHRVHGIKIDEIFDYRHACAYLSKYIAKVDDTAAEFVEGRHWGASNNLPTSPVQLVSCNEQITRRIIEKLRQWLVEHGKEQYASTEWFNTDRAQVVFISSDEFDALHDSVDFHCKWPRFSPVIT